MLPPTLRQLRAQDGAPSFVPDRKAEGWATRPVQVSGRCATGLYAAGRSSACLAGDSCRGRGHRRKGGGLGGEAVFGTAPLKPTAGLEWATRPFSEVQAVKAP